MLQKDSFLGKGWRFPPTFDNRTGTTGIVANEVDISQSLHILLSTRPGERLMQPRYGCNLDVMLFEPITTTLIAYIKDLIQTAVFYYEPRIELDTISIDTSNAHNGLILIELNYTIVASNSRFNLVYPYYLEEGTDVNFPIAGNTKPLLDY
jgi:phage baseplate assembly protein W